jgi:hypothetical protein
MDIIHSLIQIVSRIYNCFNKIKEQWHSECFCEFRCVSIQWNVLIQVKGLMMKDWNKFYSKRTNQVPTF